MVLKPRSAICAGPAFVVQAVAAGATEFTALVVATDASPPATPCGQCRDSLAEFADHLPILLANTRGEEVEYDLAELLPVPFRLDP